MSSVLSIRLRELSGAADMCISFIYNCRTKYWRTIGDRPGIVLPLASPRR
jgi:hypothetical protein